MRGPERKANDNVQVHAVVTVHKVWDFFFKFPRRQRDKRGRESRYIERRKKRFLLSVLLSRIEVLLRLLDVTSRVILLAFGCEEENVKCAVNAR